MTNSNDDHSTHVPKSNIKFAKMINVGYGAQPNQLWPLITSGSLDRSDKITASEISMCVRRIFYLKQHLKALKELGHYIPEHGTAVNADEDWGFFARGHTVEAWVCSMLDNAIEAGYLKNVELHYTGKKQKSFVSGNRSGTPDGVLLFLHPTTRKPIAVGALEIKSISERIRKVNLPKAGHKQQCNQNLDLIAEYYNLPKVGSYLVYVNTSKYNDITEFFYEHDQPMLEKQLEKVHAVMNAAHAGELEATGTLVPKGCVYCDFKEMCSDVVGTEPIKAPKNDFFK